MKQMRKSAPNASPRNQRGAVLIFCLVFLAVLTVMGVSGMESTVLEERMSGNMRDHSLAFQAAESALKNAEAWLVLQDTLPVTSTDGSTAVWAGNSLVSGLGDEEYWWDDSSVNSGWWGTNGDDLNGTADVADVASQPVYVIEQYRTVDTGQSIAIGGGEVTVPRIFHRITARGVGINSTTDAVLQSTFVQTYD